MTINTPIVNPGMLYANGLRINYRTATTFEVDPGAARNGTNINDIIINQAQTVNTAVVGVNGIDFGAIEPDKVYAVYAIGDSTAYRPSAVVFSLNPSQPIYPFGYDMSRRIGWVSTDASLPTLLKWHQRGGDQTRQYFFDSPISCLVGGAALTFTRVDLNGVPFMNTVAYMQFGFSSTTGLTAQAQFMPYGSTAPSGMITISNKTAATMTTDTTFTIPAQIGPAQKTSILYKVDAATDGATLLTIGYTDYLL